MSDDLTTAVAEAMYVAWPNTPLVLGETLNVNDVTATLARAAVAAIAAQGDITDEQIRSEIESRAFWRFTDVEAEKVVAAFRALLAQATAPLHASIANLRASLDSAERGAARFRAEREEARAEVTALRERNDDLLRENDRAWATVERVRAELPPKELCTPFQQRVLAALADPKEAR
jgi:chromosome segregation ATPase